MPGSNSKYTFSFPFNEEEALNNFHTGKALILFYIEGCDTLKAAQAFEDGLRQALGRASEKRKRLTDRKRLQDARIEDKTAW